MAAKYPGHVLHVGSRGEAVKALQRQLNTYDLRRRLAVDGDFGAETARVVDKWQENRHLGSTAEVDHVIWNAIFRVDPPKLHPRRRETRADKLRRLRVEMLARIKQRARLKPGRRKTAVIKRQRRVGRGIRKLVQPSRPRVTGPNEVRGGKPGERFQFAMNEALRRYNAGLRPSFYSQPGRFTVAYALTGEPWGFRSDCSQFMASLFRTCGLPDPNGGGWDDGYTGTLMNIGREITRQQALDEARKGDKPVMVLWDPYGLSGHVEGLDADGSTIGHGSAPIKRHAISDFNYKPGGPRFVIFD